MNKENDIGAQQHFEFENFVLRSSFKKPLNNLVALIEKNCATNLAFAKISNKHFSACAIHLFSLFVKGMLNDYKNLNEN